MMSTDKHLAIEKVGKVWRATYDGVTICACNTKRATEANAEYLMKHMHPETWRALVRANVGVYQSFDRQGRDVLMTVPE